MRPPVVGGGGAEETLKREFWRVDPRISAYDGSDHEGLARGRATARRLRRHRARGYGAGPGRAGAATASSPAIASRASRLNGDVDGDGNADRVTLRVDRRRPRACRRVVVVETASKTIAARGEAAAVARHGPAPAAARRDRRPRRRRAGRHAVAGERLPAGRRVRRARGRLVRLRLAGRRPANLFPLDDEFPASVDCTGEPGRIEVITSQVAEDDSFWDVTRSIYRARGRRFRRLSTERFRAPVGSEVTGESFRSCQARSITSTE